MEYTNSDNMVEISSLLEEYILKLRERYRGNAKARFERRMGMAISVTGIYVGILISFFANVFGFETLSSNNIVFLLGVTIVILGAGVLVFTSIKFITIGPNFEVEEAYGALLKIVKRSNQLLDFRFKSLEDESGYDYRLLTFELRIAEAEALLRSTSTKTSSTSYRFFATK